MKRIFKSFIFMLLIWSITLLTNNPHTDNQLFIWGIFSFYILIAGGMLNLETKKKRKWNNRMINLSVVMSVSLSSAFTIFHYYLSGFEFSYLRWSFLFIAIILYLFLYIAIEDQQAIKQRRINKIRYKWINNFMIIAFLAIIIKPIHDSIYIYTALAIAGILDILYSIFKESNLDDNNISFLAIFILIFYYISIALFHKILNTSLFNFWHQIIGTVIIFIPFINTWQKLKEPTKPD